MSDTKLKPCPFCGGKAIIDREDIFCSNCYLSMRIDSRMHNGDAETYKEARAQAIEEWNTRKPIDRIIEKLEISSQGAKDSKDLSKYSAYKQAISIVKVGGIDG